MTDSEVEVPTAPAPTPSTVTNNEEVPAAELLLSEPPAPPSRFRLWYALTVFSAVCLIALSTETDAKGWQAEEKWVLSVTILSLVLGSLASLAHIGMRENFVGMPIEGLSVRRKNVSLVFSSKSPIPCSLLAVFRCLSCELVVFSVGLLGRRSDCLDGPQ